MLRVGVFEIDLQGGTLRRAGVLVKLRQQPFLVLALLAGRRGLVVTREALRAAVWGDDTFVDFDQGLNYCIKEIRAALGDSADTPLYVETLPRRGYRFIAPVAVLGGVPKAEPAPLPVTAGHRESRAGDEAPAVSRRLLRYGHAVLTAAALATCGWLAIRVPPEPGEWRRVTFRRGPVSAARFDAAGGIVYSAAWSGEPTAVFAASTGSPDARILPFTEARVVGVSDGGELSFIQTRPSLQPMLARAPLAGGPAKEVLDGVLDADASRDGLSFAVVHLVAGQGSRIEYPIGHVLALANEPSNLRISPDGASVAFVEHPWSGDDRGQVVIIRADGRETARSALYPSLQGLAWSARGERVLFTASRAGSSSALRALGRSGGERTLLPAGGRLLIHDIGRDGRLLIERSVLRREVTLLAPDAAGAGSSERDLSWFDASTATAISADGRFLLLSESGDAGGPAYAVYLRGTDGSPPVRLGNGNGTALSPDGRLALAIPLEDPDHIDLLPIGPGQPRALRHAGIVRYQFATFTPDGERLVFVGGEADRNMRVFVGDLTGGAPRPITAEGLIVNRNTVSPDGRTLVGPCPPLSFCLYPLDGSAPRRLDGGSAAQPDGSSGLAGSIPIGWDPSGHALLLRSRSAGPPLRLELYDLETGERTPWRTLAPRDPVGVENLRVLVSRDGRATVLNYARRLSELYVVPPLD